MIKRLKIKFICIFMITVSLMLGSILTTVISLTHNSIEQQSITALKNISSHSASKKTNADNKITPPQKPHFMLFRGPDGKIVAEVRGSFDITDKEYESLFAFAESCSSESELVPESSLRFLRDSGPMGDKYIFADITSEAKMIITLYQASVLISFIALLIFFVIALFLAKWTVRPVEESWNNQKQFIADASHELKTPLTVIMTSAELMKNEDSYENKNKYADNILAMSKQMKGLVESLLEIARIDRGKIKKEHSVFNFSETVENAVLSFEALFYEKNQVLSTEIDKNINIKGNSEQIKQVADILLDNANKHSPEGAEIRVMLLKQGKNYCFLSVESEGETIPKEELKNIFKRFYRGDKARQMSNSYGLGLSIAESIVAEHSGKIFAKSKDGINKFTVQLHM